MSPPPALPLRTLPPLPATAAPSPWTVTGQSLRSAVRELGAYKLHSALSLLAIAIGTLGVFAVTGVTGGARSAVSGQFAALQAQLISVSGWAGGPQQNVTSPPSLTAADVAAVERLPHVIAVNSPVGFGGSDMALVAGDRTWQPAADGGVEGALPGLPVIGGYRLQAGAFFTDQDVQSLATKAVLGAAVAGHLFPNGNAVGQQFRVLNVNFQVVGVLAPLGTENGRDLDNRIYVPVTTLMQKVVGPLKGGKGPPPGAPADFALMFVNLPGIQFLVEAVTLALLGGGAGVLLGVGLGPALAALRLTKAVRFFLPSPSIETAALALAVTVALGLAFGIYPAHRASRLDPIVALRSV